MAKNDQSSAASVQEPAEIKKLRTQIKRNIVVSVIFHIITAGIIAGGVYGMTKAGFALLCVALIFAVLSEVFAISLLRENKKVERRIELEKSRLASATVFADPLYKNKGYTYDMARELYCSHTGKKEKDLTKEDVSVIWQYSYDDFAYLLMWIIENNLYQPTKDFDEDEAREDKEYVSLIKRREKLPTDYLESYDGYFMEDSVKKKARAFVIGYFKDSYEDEVRKFTKENLNAELYGFPFRWEDYDAFKVHIDKAYAEYMENKK